MVSILVILGAGTYYLFNLTSDKEMKNAINESHNKIINNAGSSKQEGSNSGSSKSGGSSTNSKSSDKSQPASKTVISSNPSLIGSNPGGEDPNEDKNSGEKNDKILKKASTNEGSSTTGDSEEESEGDDDESPEDITGLYWVDKNKEANLNNSPVIGSARP